MTLLLENAHVTRNNDPDYSPDHNPDPSLNAWCQGAIKAQNAVFLSPKMLENAQA